MHSQNLCSSREIVRVQCDDGQLLFCGEICAKQSPGAMFFPSAILDSRVWKSIKQYLIKWRGCAESEATWENADYYDDNADFAALVKHYLKVRQSLCYVKFLTFEVLSRNTRQRNPRRTSAHAPKRQVQLRLLKAANAMRQRRVRCCIGAAPV